MIRQIGLCSFLLFFIVACGGGSGGQTTPQTPGQSGSDSGGVANLCEVSLLKSDSLSSLVVSAHRARVQCRLSEEDVLKLMQ